MNVTFERGAGPVDHNPEPSGSWDDFVAARNRLFDRLAQESADYRRRLAGDERRCRTPRVGELSDDDPRE